MKAKIFLTALALVAVATFSTAQNPVGRKGTGQCDGTGKNSSYVDANKNGTCDNYETGQSKKQATKKGKGQGKKSGSGKCNNL